MVIGDGRISILIAIRVQRCMVTPPRGGLPWQLQPTQGASWAYLEAAVGAWYVHSPDMGCCRYVQISIPLTPKLIIDLPHDPSDSFNAK